MPNDHQTLSPLSGAWQAGPSKRGTGGAASGSPRHRARGFTLVEILVAVIILATAFTIVWTSFSVSLDGWRRGQQALDRLHHGDFVMEQLVGALRSTAYFGNRPEKYGFWLDRKNGSDAMSWVTSSGAFMKPGDPLARGLHRLWVGIEPDDDGEDAFAVRAFPHLLDEIDEADVDPLPISSRVKGIECRIWNAEDETWDDEWEDTNSIPSIVEITLEMEPIEPGEPPMEIVRLVELPLGAAVTSGVISARGGVSGGGGEGARGEAGQPAQQPEGAGANDAPPAQTGGTP